MAKLDDTASAYDDAIATASKAFDEWMDYTLSWANASTYLSSGAKASSQDAAGKADTGASASPTTFAASVMQNVLDTQQALLRAGVEGLRLSSALQQFDMTPGPFGLTGYFTTTPEPSPPVTPKPAAQKAVKKAVKTQTPAPKAPQTATGKTAAPTPAPATKTAQPKPQAKPQPKPKSQAKPAKPGTVAPKATARAKPTPAAKTAKPASVFLTKPKGTADDLTQIKGIGPKLSSALNDIGVFHFSQIAALKPADIAEINTKLRFNGRIEREDWISQAKALA